MEARRINWDEEHRKFEKAYTEGLIEGMKITRKELIEDELKWLDRVVPYVTERDIIMEFENRIKQLQRLNKDNISKIKD